MLLGSVAVTAQVPSTPEGDRDKIGLVLSGGGAKGAAHIGVLAVLEENRIPVDVITGTSMGAYVGGMYAMGLSAEEVKNRTLAADWQSGYEDRASRNDLNLRRKKQSDDYQVYADIGVDIDGEFRDKPGAFQGQGMAVLLRSLTDNLPEMASFDELAIPYRAMATDIAQVKPVAIDKGHLATAMQASMTVPGALKPVRWQQHLLVDGGVVNNMPVDTALQLGADVIIAVDLRDVLYGEGELDSALNIIAQLTTFMTNSSADRQKSLMKPKDIYLQPEVSFMLAPDFDKMAQAYNAGRKAALDALPQLRRYQLSPEDYQAYQKLKFDSRSQVVANSAYFIDRIELENNTLRSDQALLALLDLKVGRVVPNEELELAVNRLNAHDIFARITYRIKQLDHENVLALEVNEKSWGPGYLNFKFAFEDDFANRSDFSFGAQYLYTNLTDKGGEWQFEWLLGSWKEVSTEFYFPLDYRKQFYTSLGLGWNREIREFTLNEQQSEEIGRSGPSVIDTEYKNYTGFAEIGWNLKPWTGVAVGYRGLSGEVNELNAGERQEYSSHGPYVSFAYDDLDSYYFPAEGGLFEAELGLGFNRSRLNGGEQLKDKNLYYEARFSKPLSYQRHTILMALKGGGSDTDELIPIYVQDLGGLFNLSGFHRYELNGRYRAFGVLLYRYRLLDNNFGAFSAPVYVGGSLERGGVWDESSDIRWQSTIGAASVYLAVDSPLGPLYFAYGQAEAGESSFYLSVGSALN
nr:patatin-like phospholipase family protein [uncultured Photobacterium sp.]